MPPHILPKVKLFLVICLPIVLSYNVIFQYYQTDKTHKRPANQSSWTFTSSILSYPWSVLLPCVYLSLYYLYNIFTISICLFIYECSIHFCLQVKRFMKSLEELLHEIPYDSRSCTCSWLNHEDNQNLCDKVYILIHQILFCWPKKRI